MDCAICGKSVRQQKEGLCFRCYVISHAIRLEPELPRSMMIDDSKRDIISYQQSPFRLKPLIVDVNTKADNNRH